MSWCRLMGDVFYIQVVPILFPAQTNGNVKYDIQNVTFHCRYFHFVLCSCCSWRTVRRSDRLLCTALFEMIVGVLTTCHAQYTWDRSICIFYLIDQHSKFCYIPYRCSVCSSSSRKYPATEGTTLNPLKPSPLTYYRQFGTKSISVLMFVESQRVHI